MNNPPGDHDLLIERCEYHLVFLGRGNFIELVERQRPLIIVKSNEDIKTVEIGCLTFDEDEILNSVIFRGLGKGLDPMEVNKKLGIPFCKDIIKEEPKEPANNQGPNPTVEHIHNDTKSVQEKEIGENQMNISDNIQK